MKKIALDILLFLICFVPATFAQEQDSRQGFFADDFVKKGFERTESKSEDIKWIDPTKLVEQIKEQAASNPNSNLVQSDPSAFDAKRVVLGQHGEKILSLGLIVNAVDEEHAKENIEELIGLAQTNAIALNTVFAVGGIAQAKKDLPSVEYLWAKSQGARIKVTLGVPKQYDVSLSPTWIVETEQGLVLLEGIGSLKRAINAEGRLEFVPGVM